MKKFILNALLATIFSLMNNIAFASNFQQCPLELQVNQTVQGTIPEWKIFNSNEKHPYVGVSFSEGPPDKKAILTPNKEKKIKGGMLSIWDFTASSEGYWVSCIYAETSATLAQKLPTNIHSCEVKYDGRSSPPIVKNWHCGQQIKK